MATVDLETPPLTAGDNLTRERFLRLWELNPDIKKAELIGGIVYMPSPLSVEHGDTDNDIGGWFFTYKVATPGVACGQNATTFLLDDISQPDINLRILPEPRFPWPVAGRARTFQGRPTEGAGNTQKGDRFAGAQGVREEVGQIARIPRLT
jgi:hypothetical protein